MGRGVDCAVEDVDQLRDWLHESRNPREMRAVRPDWSLARITKKLTQLRRRAPDKSRPLKRRRTSEVVPEIETAVNEKLRQTLSLLRRSISLTSSRSTLWRAISSGAPRSTAENRLPRLNFRRDVLQRVGVLLGPWQSACGALELDV